MSEARDMAAPAVLFLDQSGEMGGAELSLLDIVKSRSGPTEVCLLSDGVFVERLRESGVKVTVIPLNGAVRRRDGALGIIRAIPNVLSAIRRVADRARHADLVYTNTMKAFVVGALARPLHRRPVLWHLRDLLTPDHFSGALRQISVWLARVATLHVIANSRATADAFVAQGGPRELVSVVYNGIDPAPFEAVEAMAARAAMVEATGLSPDLPIVGVFSRLAEWKGQHVLLEALRDLPGVQAVVVGGPLFGEEAYQARLLAIIERHGLQQRVRLLGFRKDVPTLMRAVDAVLHTSVSAEPFGRVIVEGMMATKPVIAARAGGATELVIDGITGILVEPGSAKDLARAIRRITNDSGLATALAINGRAHAHANFGVDRMRIAVEDEIARFAQPAPDRR